MITPQLNKLVPRGKAWSSINDVLIMGVGLAIFSCVVIIARRWFSPVSYTAEISLTPSALPAYAAYSLLRIAVAYVFSLLFALAYGYMAAYNATAERIMLPILDILQSIPVLSFLPGVMLAMAALFPHTQLGLELGSILLIFTGQVWNIAFSFYSSLRSIPRELIEASRINRFSRWQQLVQLELPYSAIGIVWNSMMSVAGGWFFLMVCEMFTVGSQQVMLPGLGSYLQSAASANNSSAIVWGLAAMVGVIILLDQIVWRPVIAWANKFKFEEVESASAPESMVLNLFRRSAVVEFIGQRALVPLGERLTHMFAERPMDELPADNLESKAGKWIGRVISVAVLAGAAYALFEGIKLLSSLQRSDLDMIGNGAIATFLRVAASLLIGSLWTVPVGVMIGFNPKLAKIAQPIVQIAASIPATGYYPVLLRMLLSIGIISASGNLGFAAILLMLLGTQWYILFNVIAGAMAVPTDLKEAASVFRFRSFERWRVLILPAIFPYLITGLVTAAGGAWNASIVAEYITFQNKVFSTTGLGATISAASNNFPLLLGATIVMAAMVVTFNRLVWRRLYRLAETRFKLEA